MGRLEVCATFCFPCVSLDTANCSNCGSRQDYRIGGKAATEDHEPEQFPEPEWVFFLEELVDLLGAPCACSRDPLGIRSNLLDWAVLTVIQLGPRCEYVTILGKESSTIPHNLVTLPCSYSGFRTLKFSNDQVNKT